MSLDGYLPPGCTDADVDAAFGDDSERCDRCGEYESDCERCTDCGECVHPCSCYETLPAPPPSSPLDPLRSGDIVHESEHRGCACSVIVADVDTSDDRLDVWPVHVVGDDADLWVYVEVTRRTGEIFVAEMVPQPYRAAARAFVRTFVPDARVL